LKLESGNLEFHAIFIERPEEIWGLNQQPIWLTELEVDPEEVEADKPESSPAGTPAQSP